MAGPLEQVQTEVKAALKAGDKERVSTLRLLLSAIKNEAIRSGAEVDEAGFVQRVVPQDQLLVEALRPERKALDADPFSMFLPPFVLG